MIFQVGRQKFMNRNIFSHKYLIIAGPLLALSAVIDSYLVEICVI